MNNFQNHLSFHGQQTFFINKSETIIPFIWNSIILILDGLLLTWQFLMPHVNRHIVHHFWRWASCSNVVFLLLTGHATHIVGASCRQLVLVYVATYLIDKGAALVLRLRFDDGARACDQLRGGRTLYDIELIILLVQSLVRCKAHLVVFRAQECSSASVLRRSLHLILHEWCCATLEQVLRLCLTYLLLLRDTGVMWNDTLLVSWVVEQVTPNAHLLLLFDAERLAGGDRQAL